MTRIWRRATGSRRALIAVAAAAVPAMLVLSGCEAGFGAPVLSWKQPTDGTTTTSPDGGITVVNAFVLGAPIGSALLPGQNAGVFFTLDTAGTPDTLVGITAPGVARSVTLPNGHVHVGSRPVLLTGPSPEVILDHLLTVVKGGQVVRLQLIFQNAGTVTVDAPVMPQAQYYASFSPPAPTASAAPTPSITPKPRRH